MNVLKSQKQTLFLIIATLVCFVKFLISCMVMFDGISSFDCSPCQCTSNEVWKRDAHVRLNQSFGMTCYAVELFDESQEEISFVVGDVFYSRRGCTENCTMRYNLERSNTYRSVFDRQVTWSLEAIIWIGNTLIYFICAIIGVRIKNVFLLRAFAFYLILYICMSLGTLILLSSPISGKNLLI